MMTDEQQWEQDYNLMVHYRNTLKEILEVDIKCHDAINIIHNLAKESLANFLPEIK